MTLRIRTLLILTIAGLALVSPAGAQQPKPRPNVIVFMTDDQTLENMRVMGRTNELIGRRGVTFDRSIVSLALCCPARATFLTGQYAHNHGIRTNTEPGGGHYALDHTNTLPVWLQRSGYSTVLLGKYLNQYGTKNPNEVPPGWTEWHGTVDPSTYRFYDYTFNDGGALRPSATRPATTRPTCWRRAAPRSSSAAPPSPRPSSCG